MQNVQFISTEATKMHEGKAAEIIFYAYRDNEKRDRVSVMYCGFEYVVTFQLNANGTHQAAVRNFEGVVVAIATVDEFDN
jgi:hypothetical protein